MHKLLTPQTCINIKFQITSKSNKIQDIKLQSFTKKIKQSIGDSSQH